jgi:hypothetical protein
MSSNNGGQQQGDDPYIQRQRQKHVKQLQMRQQRMIQHLNALKAQYFGEYSMPLNFPARVTSVEDSNGDSDVSLRTDKDFINARLLEAGLPLGGGIPELTPTSIDKMTSLDHNNAVTRFMHDLEGTGCYDAVQVYVGNNASSYNRDQSPNSFDVTVRLKEKKWYKLYIGGGVNSEDLSSVGGTSGGGGLVGTAAAGMPKLQFETSASLLNITGFADVSTASYSVDQTGATSFKFMHDRPLCSWFPKYGAVYESLMPPDPTSIDTKTREEYNEQHPNAIDENQVFASDNAQFSLGGGSHTTLGIHALFDEVDYESTRSYKEFTRSIGIRLANHCRGATRGPGIGGANKPSVAPPESMAGPYLFLDWSAKLRDVLPRRHAEFPFALDCSKEVATQAGTDLKHSLTGGIYLNGCMTDDRYDPTMGYDAHIMGEIAGPPGDTGFLKVKGGGSYHCPLELLRMKIFGVPEESQTVSEEEEEDKTVIGMTFHSSLNAGIIQPLTYGGICNKHLLGGAPLSDRFYVGGPGQLRGFLPAGIGPRATKVSN